MEMSKVASIGKSLHVKGELTGNEDLVIEGTVEGKITLNGHSVTIGQTGRVAAEIQAKSVVVGGQVKGNITADERVEVASTGTMVGDVRAPRVVLGDGARFKGSVDMDTKSGSGSSVAVPAMSRGTGMPSTFPDETPAYASASKI
jgi:cytoskeletal protein CcmA (bactofilin family)